MAPLSQTIGGLHFSQSNPGSERSTVGSDREAQTPNVRSSRSSELRNDPISSDSLPRSGIRLPEERSSRHVHGQQYYSTSNKSRSETDNEPDTMPVPEGQEYHAVTQWFASSPPPQPSQSKGKQRANSMTMDGPNSTPSDASDPANTVASLVEPTIMAPQDPASDGDNVVEPPITQDDEDGDDDFELASADEKGSDQSYVEELIGRKGKKKGQGRSSGPSKLKPAISAKASLGKGPARRGLTGAVAATSASAARIKQGKANTAVARKLRSIPSVGTSTRQQPRDVDEDEGQEAPEIIPNSQPIQNRDQVKPKTSTTRVAKKPFFDRLDDNQTLRGSQKLHMEKPAQTSPDTTANESAKQEELISSPNDQIAQRPSRANPTTVRNKHTISGQPQPKAKRQKIGGKDGNTSHAAATVTTKIAKSQRELATAGPASEHGPENETAADGDQQNFLVSEEVDDFWDLPTSPVKDGQHAGTTTTSKGKSKAQPANDSITRMLLTVPNQPTRSSPKKRSSPIQYGTHPRNQRRAAKPFGPPETQASASSRTALRQQKSATQPSRLAKPDTSLPANGLKEHKAGEPDALGTAEAGKSSTKVPTNNSEVRPETSSLKPPKAAPKRTRSPITISSDADSELAAVEEESPMPFPTGSIPELVQASQTAKLAVAGRAISGKATLTTGDPAHSRKSAPSHNDGIQQPEVSDTSADQSHPERMETYDRPEPSSKKRFSGNDVDEESPNKVMEGEWKLGEFNKGSKDFVVYEDAAQAISTVASPARITHDRTALREVSQTLRNNLPSSPSRPESHYNTKKLDLSSRLRFPPRSDAVQAERPNHPTVETSRPAILKNIEELSANPFVSNDRAQNETRLVQNARRNEFHPEGRSRAEPEFHPKSVAFAQRISQGFGTTHDVRHITPQDYPEELSLQRGESRPSQAVVWEQLTAAAYDRLAASLRKVNTAVIRDLGTKENDISRIVHDYEIYGEKLTEDLAQRHEKEGLALGLAFDKDMRNLETIYNEAARDAADLRSEVLSQKRTKELTQWQKGNKDIEKAIREAREALQKIGTP
ncbi:Uu.00g044840.m01.CDS01 [Anthostomella pinea]|uniref:Uu.00g044840.m01.CDS01 n=1 Tax=Anthostomella pinea TaxID=933095 RepID=A0AAI8YE94_9PEZI|nr:Uu.00g044840.m01.CDS01 [Anthostomella pinea]